MHRLRMDRHVGPELILLARLWLSSAVPRRRRAMAQGCREAVIPGRLITYETGWASSTAAVRLVACRGRRKIAEVLIAGTQAAGRSELRVVCEDRVQLSKLTFLGTHVFVAHGGGDRVVCRAASPAAATGLGIAPRPAPSRAKAVLRLSEGFLTWLQYFNHGQSSLTLASVMSGLPLVQEYSHPYDVGDLRACMDLLHCVPEWRPRLREMASVSRVWKALVADWENLPELCQAELDGGGASEASARLAQLIRSAERRAA